MNIRIKNCPFCGNKAELKKLQKQFGRNFYDTIEFSYAVVCGYCQSHGMELNFKYLNEFTNHSVQELRETQY